MNDLKGTGGIAKLLAVSLLAIAANVTTAGASSAESPKKASCSAPDHLANLKIAYAPEYPTIAKEEGIQGSTLVHVTLTRSGALKDATVAKSSGFATLDNEALLSVRASKYEPETVACQPVAGDYFVTVTFEP